MTTNKDLRVKVVNPNNGLEVGDILTWDENEYEYTTYKEFNDSTENHEYTRKQLFCIGTYSVEHSDDFVYIDKDGSEVSIKRINNNDSEEEFRGSEYINRIEKENKDLIEEVEYLKDRLNESKSFYNSIENENSKFAKKIEELQSKLDRIKYETPKDEYDLYKAIYSIKVSPKYSIWF